MRIEPLSPSDLRTPAFRHLLRLATDYDDARLDAVVTGELPGLVVLGIKADGAVTAFAAYGRDDGTTTLEYLATVGSRRGTGIGTALIAEIRRREPGTVVRAQTDDDAIGFYRTLGFETTSAPTDPRWPDRRRYDCVLPGT